MFCSYDIQLDMSKSRESFPGSVADSSTHAAGCVESPEQLITTIYQEVGDSLGLDPDADPIPINEYIDPEALWTLFNEDTGDTYVSFPLAEHRITVHSDGSVFVHQFDT